VVRIVDGGFDPVPIQAQTGDTIDLVASRVDNSKISFSVVVPAKRPPIVVRTNPAKGRVDVALNVTVSVVFSEPMDTTTVRSGSVRVLDGGQQVAGNMRWSNDALTLEFTPGNSLKPGTVYTLAITPEVRDRDGDALATSFESSFTTGVTQNGCPPGYFDPVFGCAPFLTPGPSSISGVVMERSTQGTKPAANAFVSAWVEYGPWGWSINDLVRTDADGSYTIHDLPAGGQVTLLAVVYRDNFLVAADQPCASIVKLNGGNSTGDIEIFSPADPMPDATTSLPLLSGTVFEQTDNGRQPVVGADVFYEIMALIARTTTDAKGHFSLCRLPASPGFLSLAKTGYTTTGQVTSFESVKELHLEVEMKRSP
jgi:hypothetical protein